MSWLTDFSIAYRNSSR